MLVGVFNLISCYRRGCGLELATFVRLVLSMLYPNDTLTGFAKATKTCPAATIKFEEKPSCFEMDF